MSSSSRHRKRGESGGGYNLEVTPRKALTGFNDRTDSPLVTREPSHRIFPVPPTLKKRGLKSVVDFIFDLEDDDYDEIRIFPKLAIFLLMALTFWSRNILVTGFEGLAVVHPDENFQAVEVAHSEVYGYGFRATAYEPSSTSDVQQHLLSENYSRVSWIYVHLYVFLFRLKEQLFWSASPFEVARTFYSVWSAILPFAVYKLGRTLFKQSRDIGFISASLVAFSKHMMIYGTHPLANGFSTVILLMAFVIALRLQASVDSSRATTTKFGVPSASFQVRPVPATPTNNRLALLGIIGSWFAIGLGVAIKPSASLSLLAFSLFFIPLRFATGLLPTKETLWSIISIATGLALGLIAVSAHDRVLLGEWNLSLVSWLKEQLQVQQTEFDLSHQSTYTVLMGFLRCNHVHMAMAAAVILLSTIYFVHACKLTKYFINWMNSNDIVLFRNVFWLGVTIATLAAAYSILRFDEPSLVQEVMITFIIAGSASVYLLFRRLYVYIVELAAPKQATRNIIKLILYGEIFLYMFESRVTFPGALDQKIADWSYGRCWESGYVNQCLRFVGQQPDVTGVALNYSILMTGGYSLLHHDVPIFGRTVVDYREWSMMSRLNLTGAACTGRQPIFRSMFKSNLSLATLDGVTDVVSLQNAGLFYKLLIENPLYNYVITNGTNSRFFKTGFREVFNASDFRVFKRAKSRTERDALNAIALTIPIGTKAPALEEEGRKLIAFGRYDKAAQRLRASVDIDPSSISSWQYLLTVLTRLELYDELATSREYCKTYHGPSCVV